MKIGRGASGLSGMLLVDKPQGLTSHDVVGRIRRVTGERRVGHAGTLDPMATGLLLILVGSATRLASYLTAAEKCYEARISFGTQTDTDDAEGDVIATAAVDEALTDSDYATERVAELVGLHQQVPPSFSAIKRGGITAYKAARAGEALELEARAIEVKSARLLEVVVLRNGTGDSQVEWVLELCVSKGTYIRSLARDLGVALGTVAHLSGLRRTTSGPLSVDHSVRLDALEAHSAHEAAAHFADPVLGLGLPVARVDSEIAARVMTGAKIQAGALTTRTRMDETCSSATDPADGTAVPHFADDSLVALVHEGRLLAIYHVTGGELRAATVLQGGVTGVRT